MEAPPAGEREDRPGDDAARLGHGSKCRLHVLHRDDHKHGRRRLTRISLIRDAKVKTDKGLALGGTPAQVRAAYGAKLQSGPHEYEAAPAQYLVAWDKGGGPLTGKIPPNSRGIVYEVNATGKVGAIHAGGPSVLYVEGCS